MVRTLSDISIGPGGSEFTKSLNSFAGTVIAPSSSTLAGTQQFTPISRLVAVSFSRPPSVFRRTLPRIGRVPRVETPRPTIARPRVRFSCRQLTFTQALRILVEKIDLSASSVSSCVDYAGKWWSRARNRGRAGQARCGTPADGLGTARENQLVLVPKRDRSAGHQTRAHRTCPHLGGVIHRERSLIHKCGEL